MSSFVTRDSVTFDARTTPTFLPTGYTHKPSLGHPYDNGSDTLNHLEYMPPRHAFSNTTKIETAYNASNRMWQCIHDSITMVKKP